MKRSMLVLVLLSCADASPNMVIESPVEGVPMSSLRHSPMLSAPVDLVRDEWGVAHIFGATLPDVAFVQGYVMAHDRLVQMELARHLASSP